MIAPALIGALPHSRMRSVVYLKWDRYSAMADFIVARSGSLEVPISFDVPTAKELAAVDSGVGCFPARVVVSS